MAEDIIISSTLESIIMQCIVDVHLFRKMSLLVFFELVISLNRTKFKNIWLIKCLVTNCKVKKLRKYKEILEKPAKGLLMQ